MKASKILALALATTALAPLGAHAAGPVLPTGGNVVAGSAVIGSPAGGALAISQSSSKAIIDWNGFSIGQGGAVAFNNGKGATLNRVTGGSISSLDGLLTATGSVYVINPNGVIVGKSGVVNVGGTFVASTLDVSNANFLSGGPLSFMGASNAAVLNYGKIGALGGDVALIAAKVSNAGEIDAANGDAGLLAGYKVVLTDASLDQGRFAVELGGSGTSATNAGLIQAADAELRAEGGNVYALAGDTAGVIRATGVSTGGGHVWLVADGGTLDVAGTLEAQGAGGTAGSIETSGQTVSVGAASIDAHGGTWLVDPDDLTIDVTAATTIDNALNGGTSVTEQTTATGTSGAGTVNTAGNGDIIVAAPLSWTTNAALTLSAYRNVTLDAADTIASTGGGAVTLQADNTGTGVGTVNFGLASGVSTSGAVTIFYNPVSYTDAATRSTQVDNGSNTGTDNYTNPYAASVTGGGALRAYMLVNSLTQLQGISTELDGLYALSQDIDASSSATMNPISGAGFAGWQPLGTDNNNGKEFSGALNGQGHAISGLFINSTTAQTGLFGAVSNGAVITNLGVTNANVTGTADATGILVGTLAGLATLTNDYSTGTVSGGGNTGGLIGKGGGIISNSYSTATVSGGGSVGGFAGNLDATLTNVYATGKVSGTAGNIGGLVGIFAGVLTNGYATGAVSTTGANGGGDVGGLFGSVGGYVNGGYATGSVTDAGSGDQYIGGLFGFASGNGNGNTSYQNIYATGAVSGKGNDVGGLVGFAYLGFSAVNAFATGNVTSTGYNVGGLAGQSNGTISTSYASGAVSGSGAVGGLVGSNVNPTASITDSYATGAVTGVQSSDGSVVNYIGGLVGSNNINNNSGLPSIVRSYATGLVSGVGALGGLVGGNNGTITNSIWDRTSTGQTSGVGKDLLVNGAPTTTVTNLTSVQDTDPTAADYAFSTTPYTNAGFQFGTTPGGTAGETWVQVDADGSFNGAGGATVGTRPFLLMEYTTAITNAHQLQLAELNLTANYTLGADLDASGTSMTWGMWGPAGFIPIAPLNSTSSEYNGTFNGQSHTIDGLYINVLGSGQGNEGLTGLFGLVGAGTITNVGLVGGSVSGVTTDVGALVGDNLGTISNVYSTASVGGGENTGGLVGVNSGTVAGAYSTGTVAGATISQDVGGLIGSDSGAVSNAHATGAVSGATAGGLIGEINLIGVPVQTFSNLYATGAVRGTSAAGGLVGENLEGTLSSDYATGAVNGANNVGGLVGGLIQGNVTASYASGAVTGSGANTGGLIGYTYGGALITDSYATGPVTASGVGVGGLVGAAELDTSGSSSNATITDSFATGAVNGTSEVGGLVGSAQGLAIIAGSSVGKTYASGSVTGTGMSVGGLVGENAGAISLASYIPSGAGVTGAADVGGAVGLNDAGGTVYDVSVTASVLGTSYTGGVAGDNFGGISNVSFDGLVSGGGGVGGLVGVEEGGSTLAGTVGANHPTTVSGTGDDVGGVAGASFAAIIGAVNQGNVTGRDDVGGLVGYNAANLNGASYGTVSGRDYVGGVVGLNYGSATGTVSGFVNGGEYVGGLVGWNDAAASVAGSGVAGSVTVAGTGDYVGGLAGVNKGTMFDDFTGSANVGSVVGSDYVGGLVGLNQGAVSYSSAAVPVTGNLYVGGLVGWNDTGATITTSYATGSVTGLPAGAEAGTNNDYVGGLVGVNYGSIANTYATGAVSGVQVVGGLVGTNMPGGASVATSYATGAVSASAGAVGTTFGVQAGEVTEVYGFPSLSGQPTETGYYNAGATGDGTDLTAAQEDGSAAYVGFDFTNTWQSNPNGPPTLQPPAN